LQKTTIVEQCSGDLKRGIEDIIFDNGCYKGKRRGVRVKGG
jgi:hypothetical protein